MGENGSRKETIGNWEKTDHGNNAGVGVQLDW